MLTLLTETVVLGNSLIRYLTAVAVFIITLIVIKIFRRQILKRLKIKAEKTKTTLDDFLLRVIDKILSPALYFGAFYVSISMLTLGPFLKKAVDMLALAVVIFCATRFCIELIIYVFSLYWAKRGRDIKEERSLEGILNVIKFIVWTLAVIFFLDNLGFKISTVIAGLGIGGVAVALAAQTVLKDLFSYFSILFDRPFELGDFIIVGEYLGTIEHIGIKTTRIRSLGGEQVIFSNTDLTDSRVRNYKRMGKRRVVFKLGVIYSTPLEELKEIPKIVGKVIKSIEDAVFDRAHFFEYGDFSLVYEVVYYVLSSDYNKYMDIQQEINFKINEEFKKRNIEFAYPTQTLYVQKSS